MSNSYVETHPRVVEDIIKHTNKCTPPQRSPNSDLQYFYENFNPESNEACLFGTSCNIQEKQVWNETNSDLETQVWIYQVNPACERDTEIYVNGCHESPLNKQVTRAVHESKLCHRGKQIKKTITKKRKRTTFTTEQIIAMEQIFKTRPYICREERHTLTQKLRVSERSIKVWFQNRRRLSEKREKLYVPDSPSSVDTCDLNCDRLTYIESQINERVDPYGNVTLDDNVMTELVRIIDDYLPQQAETLLHCVPEENTDSISSSLFEENYENHPMYEPISPASVLDEFLL